MASVVFDASELTEYAQELEACAKYAPKLQKKFLRREGSKLLRKTKQSAKSVKAGKITEKNKDKVHYHKSIKRGKVYTYQGTEAIRVYSNAPHAHLIESGHRMVTHDGREVGFVPGKHVFEKAGKAFEPVFVRDIDQLLEESTKNL